MALSAPTRLAQNAKVCVSHKPSSRTFLLIAGLMVALFSPGVSADRCHKPEKTIGTELGLAADICAINDALGRSPPDYVTAETIYRVGSASKNPSLKDVATGSFSGSFSASSFGQLGAGWINTQLQNAFDGKSGFDTPTKRVQFIKKILQSSLLGNRMFSNLERAYSSAQGGRASAALTHWERALADHYGQNSACSIFANGQARGIEFGVMVAGVSIANDEIGDAFGAGGRILKARRISASRLRTQINIIQRNFIVIYLQAVAKYATRIQQSNNAEEGQAEGYAYYHAILPLVRAANAAADTTILDCFGLGSAPSVTKANAVLALFPGLLNSLNISARSFGTYNEGNSGTYSPPSNLSCEANNPFQSNNVQAFDNDR